MLSLEFIFMTVQGKCQWLVGRYIKELHKQRWHRLIITYTVLLKGESQRCRAQCFPCSNTPSMAGGLLASHVTPLKLP